MKPAVMIRDQLADYLTQHDMSINQFAIRSGINSGTLSRIINGHQPIAMSHLELITAGMGLGEDFLQLVCRGMLLLFVTDLAAASSVHCEMCGTRAYRLYRVAGAELAG